MNSTLPYLTALVAVLAAATARAQYEVPDARSGPAPPAAAGARNPGERAGARGAESSVTVGAEAWKEKIPATTADLSPGDRLLAQAMNQLERRASVTARLRHQATLGGQRLFGVGRYWQQGSGESLRVRLELQIAGQEARLLQVSNSRFLWIEQQLPTGRNVSRIDLRQLRAEPSLAAGEVPFIQPGEASWSPIRAELVAHCGGLPSLLASLGDCFSFLPPQAMRLSVAPPLVQQPIDIPVFAVVGHWKESQLARLATATPRRGSGEGSTAEPGTKGAPGPVDVPAHLPAEVLLLVGQADLFPYRIEYRRQETPREGRQEDGGAAIYQLSANPIVVLEMSDVEFDTPIAAGQFEYSAPVGTDWVDRTAQRLQDMRR